MKPGILADQTTGGDDVIDVVLRANLFYRSGDNQEDIFRFAAFAQNNRTCCELDHRVIKQSAQIPGFRVRKIVPQEFKSEATQIVRFIRDQGVDNAEHGAGADFFLFIGQRVGAMGQHDRSQPVFFEIEGIALA